MSRRRALALLALAALGTSACTSERSEPPEDAVRRSFAEYKSAAMAGRGAEAARLLSSMTVNHFGRLRDLALHAPADEVRAHSCVNQLSIFRLRQFVPAEELRSMSAEQTLAYALSQGWVGRDVVANVELGQIEMHGSGALGEVLIDGLNNEWWHILVEEEGRWRFDLLQGYGISESEFSGLARDNGIDKTELALAVLEGTSGVAIDRARLLAPLVPLEPLSPPAG
jgi:hypothetical protein